jgi:hypothetical protein
LIINHLWQDLGNLPNESPSGAFGNQRYRQKNDSNQPVLPTASPNAPSEASRNIIAGLAWANMSLRVPLMRLVEKKDGAFPTKQMLPRPPVRSAHIISL